MESIYRWQGKIESTTEILAIFKTTRAVLPAFQQALIELHPYEVLEIISLSPDQVADAYRAWVLNNVALPDQ